MPTIPTTATNPLDNCQRLYPSIGISPKLHVVGKRRSPALTITFRTRTLVGQCQACLWCPPCRTTLPDSYWAPADGICSQLRQDFGTFPLPDAKTITVSGTRKRGADVRYWPIADIRYCSAHVRF